MVGERLLENVRVRGESERVREKKVCFDFTFCEGRGTTAGTD